MKQKIRENLKYMGWNIGYMLRQYTPEAQKLVVNEIIKSMEIR